MEKYTLISKKAYGLLGIIDIIVIASLYGGRIAFIYAKRLENLSIHEREDMIDYSALWMKLSTFYKNLEPILTWGIGVLCVVVLFLFLIKKTSKKAIIFNYIFLFFLSILNVIPYFVMVLIYGNQDTSLLWMDACMPIYNGIKIAIKYGLVTIIIVFLFRLVKPQRS